jgi:DNA-directed RNA polymerase specialized sigma24 family protein
MQSDDSVSRWLAPLQQGDPAAVQQLWQRYFVSLAKLARRALGAMPLRAHDEEDVALSAFDSFCRNAEQGRFPDLQDRDNLWRLLAVITMRKAYRLRRDEGRQKRGSLDRGGNGANDEAGWLDEVLSKEPSPAMATQMAEEYERLLLLLQDDQLKQVAVMRMENHTVQEIALHLGCAPRSVKRKLQLIRNLWEGVVVD